MRNHDQPETSGATSYVVALYTWETTMFESACLSLEQWRFFRSWVANPLRVAAVAPSSDSLARIMTNEITPLHSPVLELGAGTGVFTRALLNRGVPEEALTLVEFGSEFARLLQFRFPRARVLWMDASQLAGHNIFQERSVGAVVSGLPLLSMTPRKVMSILIVAFLYIRADGAFYQFTYGPRCPISRSILDRLGLKARRIGGTVRNLPPAAVYRITRRPPPRGLAGNPGIFLAAPRYPIDCGVSQHLKFSVTT